MALELAKTNTNYEEKTQYYFRVFLDIAYNLNDSKTGLWDEKTNFFCDKINNSANQFQFLDHKNLVGLLPLIACCTVEINQHFETYITYYLNENPQYKTFVKEISTEKIYLSILPEERFFKITSSLFNENEFWGKYGIRSLSKQYDKKPYSITLFGNEHTLKYQPNESDTTSFGENSNWRGPVWIPTNYVLLKSLEIHALYYGNKIQEKASELAANIQSIFEKDANRQTPVYANTKLNENEILSENPLFFEFFNPETGRGCGASHQTGWTGLIVNL